MDNIFKYKKTKVLKFINLYIKFFINNDIFSNLILKYLDDHEIIINSTFYEDVYIEEFSFLRLMNRHYKQRLETIERLFGECYEESDLDYTDF